MTLENWIIPLILIGLAVVVYLVKRDERCDRPERKDK